VACIFCRSGYFYCCFRDKLFLHVHQLSHKPAMSNSQGTANSITLKGSAKIIHDYMLYSVNSILFQRGIYPAGQFRPEEYNNVPVMVLQNRKVAPFITKTMEQVEKWIMEQKVEKVTMMIYSLEKKEAIERWDFNIEAEYDDVSDATSDKLVSKIQAEIRAVMRQILSTISFLPCIEQVCTFDLIIQMKDNADVNEEQILYEFQRVNKDNIEVKDAHTMSLKIFSTGVNKVETQVYYKVTQ
uniref:HORMA domain-containing protein n=1 Tax=Anopheles dirus TaxID=7168 RepID=A0A182NA17_9DIPT